VGDGQWPSADDRADARWDEDGDAPAPWKSTWPHRSWRGDSCLRLAALPAEEGTNVSNSWRLLPDIQCPIQRGAGDPPWQKLDDFVARATNRFETVRDPAVSLNRFYRLVSPRVP